MKAQRGAASLALLLLLLAGGVLVAAWSQRVLHTEWQALAQQTRQARADAAAEAGLAWAQALLNLEGPISDDCLPAGGAGAGPTPGATPAQRWLGEPDDAGRFHPGRGRAAPPEARCASQAGGGWRCHCPSPEATPAGAAPGTAAPLAPPDPEAEPPAAFVVQWLPGRHPASVDVSAIGCSEALPPCAAADGDHRAAAQARRRLTLARLPALLRPPAAALTLRGRLATVAPLGVHNPDAATAGLAVLAGGPVKAPALRIGTAPGAPPAAAVVADDEALAAQPADALFTMHFGLPPRAWAQLPGVISGNCGTDCAAWLQQHAAGEGAAVRVALPGPLVLEGPLALGRPQRPLLLVVDGDLRLRGPVQLHGLLQARHLQWDGLGPGEGGWVRGAVLLGGDLGGDGAPDLVLDPRVLQRLRQASGSWLRVPGSWRDH